VFGSGRGFSANPNLSLSTAGMALRLTASLQVTALASWSAMQANGDGFDDILISLLMPMVPVPTVKVPLARAM